MEGPRSPAENELGTVIDFLNSNLRQSQAWSISAEYPTALTNTNIHNMRIITENEKILSHAVLKPLIIKSPHVIFKVGAIGSVVTNPDHRSQGLSTNIISNCLDEAQRQQCDVAILWTDLFDFYRRMGFELAGNEISFVIDRPLETKTQELRFSNDSRIAPEAILRLFMNHTVNTVRTAEEVRKFLAIPQTKIYTAWTANNQLAAYAIEGKGADLSGYIHEWGGGVNEILSLVSWIQKTQNKPLTLIAPAHSQNLVRELKRQNVMCNEGFLGMIKILNFDQLANKVKRAFRNVGVTQIVLEKGPGAVLFGVGEELFTLQNEADVARLLFGPVHMDELDMLSEKARAQLGLLLPLPFWLWGWDSI